MILPVTGTPSGYRGLVATYDDVARLATELLADAGKHGHSHAIDAMVCATAIASPKPVRVLTSDPDDITALAGEHVSVIAV